MSQDYEEAPRVKTNMNRVHSYESGMVQRRAEEQQQMERQRQVLQGQKEDGHEIARGLFQDSKSLRAEIQLKKNQVASMTADMEVDEQHKRADISLGELFDGNEIDDQYATKPDKLIAETDIPERLQLKLKERLSATAEELQDEAKWIFDRFTNEKGRNDFHNNREMIMRKI